MASVFLSYDHEDAERAGPIASALEKAGHSVWWDRQIHGGAQFNAEIERAVEEADAVVVLWSPRSIQSAWVRDEAAEGRDQGKLVPITLEGAKPPMGFRQFQTIDLSGWKGRKPPPKIPELLHAIEKIAGGTGASPPATPAPAQPIEWRRRLSLLRLPALAVVLLMLVAAAIAWKLLWPTSKVPSVAIEALAQTAASNSLAQDLFVKLGSLQAARADALQLVEQSSDAKPDLRFRVDQRVGDKQIHATVALLAGDNGELLWSREFQKERRREADLRQQVAYSAAQVLACASEAMSNGRNGLETATLKLYLNGCAGFSEGFADIESLVEIFSKVTERAPNFEDGWAKLLLAETEAFIDSGLSDKVLRKKLQAHIRQARKLDPTMAEAYIAEAWMQPLRPISGWMRFTEEAVRRNPHHAYALANHSEDMFHVGRVQQAIEDMRQAVRSDPLSPSLRGRLINALANGNEFEAARKALEEAERLWPGASNLIGIRFDLFRRYGDPREALNILRSGAVSRQFVSPAVESFLEARIDPSPAKIAKAIDDARAVSARWPASYVQTLAEFGRKDELIRALNELDTHINLGPAEVMFQADFSILHNDTRFMAIANRWGMLDYWRTSGSWPDLCFKPDLPYDCKAEAAKLS